MIYKILIQEDNEHGLDQTYNILLKEDDIDYIEKLKKPAGHMIHLKREIQLRYGEKKEDRIHLWSLSDMEVFPS